MAEDCDGLDDAGFDGGGTGAGDESSPLPGHLNRMNPMNPKNNAREITPIVIAPSRQPLPPDSLVFLTSFGYTHCPPLNIFPVGHVVVQIEGADDSNIPVLHDLHLSSE